MAQTALRSSSQLDDGWILAPERYDPRREASTGGIRLHDLVRVVRDQVSPRATPNGRYLVLDTGDAREGVVLTWKQPVDSTGLGSVKKVVEPGDVVISRLRPYLRQVAYIDRALGGEYHLVCSTEFYVLRSLDDLSIAFLVLFLLSAEVQQRLNAAQEGGHHPRFNQDVLERLIVPETICEARFELSRLVDEAISASRIGQQRMIELLHEIDTREEAPSGGYRSTSRGDT